MNLTFCKSKVFRSDRRHPVSEKRLFIKDNCDDFSDMIYKSYPFEKAIPHRLNERIPVIEKDFIITLNDKAIAHLHPKFEELYNAITTSKYILDYKHDWDDKGSKPYSSETWIKAIRFLVMFYKWRERHDHFMVKCPKIYEGPDGSIDIDWKSKTFTYLINIPEDGDIATYYYKTLTGTKIEGEFDVKKFKVEELQHSFDSEFLNVRQRDDT